MSLLEILQEFWFVIVGLITVVVWVIRMEGKVKQSATREDIAEVTQCIALLKQEQTNMRSDYREELGELKTITGQLTETTQNLNTAVAELKTIIAERIPKG